MLRPAAIPVPVVVIVVVIIVVIPVPIAAAAIAAIVAAEQSAQQPKRERGSRERRGASRDHRR
jgi:hypothetical protein